MIKTHQHSLVESTQSEALRLIQSGETPPFCVLADEQTGGRGRAGRVWHSEKGRSLLFTLVHQMESHSLSGLSLFVGYQLTREFSNLSLKLKWPNDLMLEDKKIGGILIEAHTMGSQSIVLIGVGLNLLTMQTANYSGLNSKVDAHSLIDRLSQAVAVFPSTGLSIADCKKILWKCGEKVQFQTSEGLRTVTVEGLDERGFLITKEGATLRLELDGEILFE